MNKSRNDLEAPTDREGNEKNTNKDDRKNRVEQTQNEEHKDKQKQDGKGLAAIRCR